MRALLGVLILLTLVAPAFAQTPPIYPGTPTVMVGVKQATGVDMTLGSWEFANFPNNANLSGWTVSRSGNNITITPPPTPNATVGTYTLWYADTQKFVKNADGGDYYDTGPAVTFQVVPAPPTRPVPGPGPAFSWQGSVAGLNTANGNKLTTLPITGWSTRGGMAVSIVLYHNSQASTAVPGPCGLKWQMGYFSYLSAGASGGEVLHWDNGSTYAYSYAGGAFVPPYGILDTLTNSSGTYTLTTPGQTKYTFVTLPNTGGNAYLSSITDLDGNTITIGHNANTGLSSVSDGAGRAATFGYDGSGRLASVTDPLGRRWALVYDGVAGTGNLWYVADPAVGNASSPRAFAYNSTHDITTAQDRNGNLSNFGYDGNDSLLWARDPLGSQTNVNYYPATTVVTDPNGHTLTHTYSASRLASVTDTLGDSESYAYDWNNILTQKTDKNKQTWLYNSHFSNTQQPLSTSYDPLGNSSSVTYDSKNKPLVSTDAVGNTTTNAYSTDGHEDLLTANVTSAANVPGTSAKFTATSTVGGYQSGLPTTFQDPLKNPASSVAYDPYGWGLPVTATDPNGNPATATYNALGWKLTSTDALGHTTRTAYDAWGRVTVVTAPDGTQSGMTYDANGNVQRVTDADGYTAAPLYAVHCGGGAVGHFAADAYGSGGYVFSTGAAVDTSGAAYPAPASLYQSERAGTFTYAFPGLPTGRLYTIRLHFAEISRNGPGLMQFNVAINGGRVLTNFDPFAAAGGFNRASVYDLTYSPDANGQIAVAFTPGAGDAPTCSGIEILPYGHTVTNLYDADNRLTTTYNGRGDVVSYTYDGPNGRGSVDANGQTQYGLLSRKTDGNGSPIVYTYTARNEPYQTFYNDGTHESIGTTPTNGYDANGNVLLRVKADGAQISYKYDADNRLTGITYPHPNTPNVGFGYDAGGRRTSMTDGSGTTSWVYGDGLHLSQLHSPRGDVYYGYDADGRRANMTAPGVNPSSPYATYTYGYDPGGRLSSLVNPFSEATGFSYDAADRLTQKRLANGAYVNYGYDAADQMLGLTFYFPALGGSYSHAYTYEPNGNLSSRAESDNCTNAFLYDGADQMTSELRTGPSSPFSKSYTYDANGNRLTQTVNGTLAQQFSYNGHDVVTSGIGETFGWDLNGNMTSDTLNGGHTGYTWDDEDRLLSQTFPDGHTDSYTYTGLGMRLTKNDPSGAYSYLADGVSPASDVLSDGRTTFTPGVSEAKGIGNGQYASEFYLADRQGNSRGLLNGGQGNTDGYNWDGFGTLMNRVGSNPTAYGWGEGSGYQTDNDGGLRLLGHRYYDSRSGRFISQDPAGDGDNWYAYADNSPTNEDDPEGLAPPPNPDVGDNYAVDRIGAMEAFANMGLNNSSSLDDEYHFYNVYKIRYYLGTGNIISTTFLFSFAVPSSQNLDASYAQALHDRDPLAWIHYNRTQAYFSGGNGIGHGTPGEYYNQSRYPYPKGLSPRIEKQLTKLLDHGGNFHGGMVAEGYGTKAWENPILGAVAKSRADNRFEPDDFTGQGMFSAGWNFGWQRDPYSPKP